MRIKLNEILNKPRIDKLVGILIFELTGKRNRVRKARIAYLFRVDSGKE
jgi:hypothetical protein